jgi:O-antigen/teichoic acid export membrane protein
VRVSKAAGKELLSFGGWMTVSNVVSPAMVNMDRLFIGSLLTVSAVTYYVTPFEVVSKLLVIPSAIAGASFPEFSRLSKASEGDDVRHYFLSNLRLVAALLVPAALVLFVVAHPLLSVWVSAGLAERSAGIMRLLAVGIVVNGLAYIPFAYVQGMGRSDVTARFHLLELVAYVPALYLLIGRFGLIGVAMAWVMRVSLDAVLLFGYSATHLRRPAGVGRPALGAAGGT